MIDWDKTRPATIRTVPGHGELTQEEQEEISELIDWAIQKRGERYEILRPQDGGSV